MKSEGIILIVDDNPENLNLLRDSLKKSGFRISVAQSGEDALKRVKRRLPDIILLDVKMPDGMDGFETCRQLKENETTKDTPVIFLTALSQTIEKIKGFNVGGVDFITKPFQPEEVLARVNAHLTIRKLQQELQEENARFRALSDATFEGIVIHNDDGRIIDVNRRFEEMFGHQRNEVLGKHIQDFIMPELWKTVEEHIRTNDEHLYEVQGKKKGGLSFPMEIQVKAMPSKGHEVRIAAIRDLSPLRTLEKETIKDRYRFGELIGKSPAIQTVYQHISQFAESDEIVLICGETGTGKGLVARTLHQQSKRKERAFIQVNCSAVSENLFESEFFGYCKGAFTDAKRDKPGLFEQAHGGTLFLDELGELPLRFQAKLLHVLDDQKFIPVGGTISKEVNVRLIVATNKHLKEMVQQGSLREDLYYRINVLTITMPPLRDRKEDILLLIEHFFTKENREDKKRLAIPAEIIEMCYAYDWPGNVRELENAIKRYRVTKRLNFLKDVQSKTLDPDGVVTIKVEPEESLREAVELLEKSMIEQRLIQNGWHQEKTARALDITPKTLRKKMKQYDLKN